MFNTKPSYYSPDHGDHKGQTGLMIMRFCDPSYDDIGLRFNDGEERNFHFRDVTKVEMSEAPVEVKTSPALSDNHTYGRNSRPRPY